jgi:hypothetical protein
MDERGWGEGNERDMRENTPIKRFKRKRKKKRRDK